MRCGRLHFLTTHGRSVPLARKPNYDFVKRRKELDRKAEKDEKMRRKREEAASRREQARVTEEARPESPDAAPDQ
jgi:hypothetical protein